MRCPAPSALASHAHAYAREQRPRHAARVIVPTNDARGCVCAPLVIGSVGVGEWALVASATLSVVVDTRCDYRPKCEPSPPVAWWRGGVPPSNKVEILSP